MPYTNNIVTIEGTTKNCSTYYYQALDLRSFFMNIPLSFQNFFGLLRYGILSQILYFLTIPIILKKYNPEDYGIFTIVFSIASVVGTLSALRLERAIVVEEVEKIKPILIRCFLYILASSLLCSIILFFALKSFNLQGDENTLLILFGTVYCFLFGGTQIFTHIAIRQKKLMLTGISDTIYALLLFIFLFVLSEDLYKQTVLLILIFTLSRLISIFPYTKLEIKPYFKDKTISSALTFKELRKYHVPVLTVLLSNIQFKGIFYLTGIHYGESVTGNLSMAQRLTYAPVNLIGASLRKSFFLEFTKNKQDFQIINGYINKVLKYGSILSLALFPIFLIIVENVKPYIPKGWEQISYFALALYPTASVLILLSWLDRIYDAQKKQPLALLYESIYTIVLYAVLLLALAFGVGSNTLILIFTFITVFYNLIWAFLTLKLVKSQVNSMLYLTLIHFILLGVVSYILTNN